MTQEYIKKQNTVQAEVVGKISLMNDGVFEDMWRVTDAGTYTYLVDSVFRQQYKLHVDPSYEAKIANAKNENEIALLREQLANLKSEYENVSKLSFFYKNEYEKLLELAKETFNNVRADISDITQKSNAEFSSLVFTLDKILEKLQ